ncbi:MAG: hypothetical protein ACPLRY_03410 [Candidatus Bathyarchaeales archaeon]
MSEAETPWTRRKLVFRIAKATFITAIVGVAFLILWFFTSMFSAIYPQYSTSFAILAWATLFFTFATTLSEETIYKYIFIVMRAFFLIVYFAYATNFGLLSLNIEGLNLTIEFMPLLALMVLANLLDMARGLLQAIEFASQSPKD